MSYDRDVWSDLRVRWLHASDRERVVFLLILGAFFGSCPACVLFGSLAMGDSLTSALNDDLMLFGLPGLLMLLGAAAIYVKWRIGAGTATPRKRRTQADPDPRARQAEIRRLHREGSLVSQPDLARELDVKSPTVRRWCKRLSLEPAYQLGRNYYTSKQADLIRRYGIASTAERREILKELVGQASDCTACGAWNPPASQHCGECGAALEGAEA